MNRLPRLASYSLSAANQAAHNQESMMKRLATIPLASLLLFAFALPSAAKHPDRVERERRQVVHNGAPQPHYAAAELDGLAHRLLDHARRDARHPSRAERRALRKLRRLGSEATAFRIRTEQGRRGHSLARNVYSLERRLSDAAHRFHVLHPDGNLRRDFQRVAHAIDGLGRQHERRVSAQGRHHRSGGYEIASYRHHKRH